MLKFKKDGKIVTLAQGSESVLLGFDRLSEDNKHVHEEYELSLSELTELQQYLNDLLGNDY